MNVGAEDDGALSVSDEATKGEPAGSTALSAAGSAVPVSREATRDRISILYTMLGLIQWPKLKLKCIK